MSWTSTGQGQKHVIVGAIAWGIAIVVAVCVAGYFYKANNVPGVLTHDDSASDRSPLSR